MRPKALLLAIPALITLAAAAPGPKPLAKPMVLGFAVKDGAKPRHPALVSVHPEGPCGASAKLRVSAIPAFKPADALTTGTATEIDAGGKALRRWRLPEDYVVNSLDGDWLLASYAGKSAPVWIHTSGKLGTASAADSAVALGQDGVVLTKTCKAGADLQCLSVRDRPAKTRRTVTAPGVCS